MEYTGVRLFNSYYVKTPEATFKIAELMFSAGAWGPMIVQPFSTSGPYSFFLWCTFGSWILVLLTYLLGLFKLSPFRMDEDKWRRYLAPDLNDLYLNVVIAVAYVPAIIVFGVFSFPEIPGVNVGAFIIVMAVLTCLIHVCHASTLALFFMMGADKWQKERRWIWQKSTLASKVNKPAQKTPRSANYEEADETRPGRYEEPSTSQATAPQDDHHEIYQDVN